MRDKFPNSPWEEKKDVKYKIETRCIHNENPGTKDDAYGAVTVPIFQTATFSHPGIGRSTGYDYTRESNPTRSELEEIVSSLEGAVDTVACSSGMAAIGLCLELFHAGDHLICSEDLYGGSIRIFQTIGEQKGLQFSYIDTSDQKLVRKEIRKNTKALYIETPSNPTMQVTDLAAMKGLAEEHGLDLIVDNTFLSPYFQNPLKFGADLVIHSGTKFLGGHNDTLAGFLCTSRQDLAEKIRYLYKTMGSCLSPFDSFLITRGIKTLSVRLERQQSNAVAIAAWLKQQKKIEQVYYVGLPEHPGYEIMKKQARGFGSMITFRVDSKGHALQILKQVRMIKFAESLGGVETLITYPTTQTHADVPEEVRLKNGITPCTLRLSTGIEDIEDLLGELSEVFASLQ